MRRITFLIASILAFAVVAGTAQAAPLTVQLVRTSVLYNEDPPGAPLPLGRTQYDAGDIKQVRGGAKIGEYVRLKSSFASSQNAAAVTITLLFGVGNPPASITLQGTHSFNNGNETGSVSASSLGFIGGVPFTYDGATGVLVIQFP
jgi:hypothetical protein